ncbi:thiamine pyrophosphokinase [Gemmobacter lanyuensis]
MRADLRLAQKHAPMVVAADGGADRALALGVRPAAVIGDFDSISAAAKAQLQGAQMLHLAEQETTDFDKALRSIRAPMVLALGVMGAGRSCAGSAVGAGAAPGQWRRALRAAGAKGRGLCRAAPPALAPAGGRAALALPLAPVRGKAGVCVGPSTGLSLRPMGGSALRTAPTRGMWS